MEDWFTIEKIDAETFAISEYKHWEETHSYLLCGEEKAALIDTVIITHVHWDHIGGHKYFRFIAVHEAEKEWLAVKFPIPLQAVKNSLICKPCDFPSDFKIDQYEIFRGVPQMLLHDGDSIDLGKRTLSVIHTPGHSPGHCCFYEPDKKYIYSGDKANFTRPSPVIRSGDHN